MKKSILLLFLLCVGTTALMAQLEIPQTQKSLYGVFEATWCGNCGQFGIPVTKQVQSATEGKAAFLTMHSSSSSQLHSSTATQIASAVGAPGQPYWSLNGVAVGSYNANLQNELIDDINAGFSDSSAAVNAGYKWHVSQDTIYVETMTAFFNDANGEFYLSVYLIEDSIWAFQANYDPAIPNGNIYHDNILRTSFSSSAFGEEIATGAIAEGDQFSKQFKLKVAPEWNLDNVRLTAVVWEKNGNDFTFRNVNDQGKADISTSISETTLGIDAKIYPNPTDGNISIALGDEIKNGTISIFNALGSEVYRRSFDGNQVKLNLEQPSGIYLLKVESANSQQVTRIIKR